MFATLSRYNENDEAEYWGDVDRFKFRITITMEERLALKRQEEEDTLGGSSSGIVRAHIQQFGGGSSRPTAGGSWAPTNREQKPRLPPRPTMRKPRPTP